MEEIIGSAALVLLGAVISIVSQWVKNLSDRDTHSSNRIFEVRLDALNVIWEKFSVALFEFSPSMGLGFANWKDSYFEKADKLRREFRSEVEKRQIVLDKTVIQGFKQIDSDLSIFASGELHDQHGKPIGYAEFYRTKLQPHLQELALSINKTMDISTHTIDLSFEI